MQISKDELRKIIREEVERSEREDVVLENLVESYAEAYASSQEGYVSKESVVDFLEVLDENKIPVEALQAFLAFLPEDSVRGILREALED